MPATSSAELRIPRCRDAAQAPSWPCGRRRSGSRGSPGCARSGGCPGTSPSSGLGALDPLLWLCAERCPTNATYVPLPPMHPAKLSMRWAPKAGLSNGSMSTSVFSWLLALWVTTTIPARRAREHVFEDAGSFGTTGDRPSRCAIRRRMIATCLRGLQVAGGRHPGVDAGLAANRRMPVRMRSNQASPRTLTTVTMGLRALGADSPAAPLTLVIGAPTATTRARRVTALANARASRG